jgi:hypothetical protein
MLEDLKEEWKNITTYGLMPSDIYTSLLNQKYLYQFAHLSYYNTTPAITDIEKYEKIFVEELFNEPKPKNFAEYVDKLEQRLKKDTNLEDWRIQKIISEGLEKAVELQKKRIENFKHNELVYKFAEKEIENYPTLKKDKEAILDEIKKVLFRSKPSIFIYVYGSVYQIEHDITDRLGGGIFPKQFYEEINDFLYNKLEDKLLFEHQLRLSLNLLSFKEIEEIGKKIIEKSCDIYELDKSIKEKLMKAFEENLKNQKELGKNSDKNIFGLYWLKKEMEVVANEVKDRTTKSKIDVIIRDLIHNLECKEEEKIKKMIEKEIEKYPLLKESRIFMDTNEDYSSEEKFNLYGKALDGEDIYFTIRDKLLLGDENSEEEIKRTIREVAQIELLRRYEDKPLDLLGKYDPTLEKTFNILNSHQIVYTEGLNSAFLTRVFVEDNLEKEVNDFTENIKQKLVNLAKKNELKEKNSLKEEFKTKTKRKL